MRRELDKDFEELSKRLHKLREKASTLPSARKKHSEHYERLLTHGKKQHSQRPAELAAIFILLFVGLGVFSLVQGGSITGFASLEGNEKIDPAILEELQNNEYVSVLVELSPSNEKHDKKVNTALSNIDWEPSSKNIKKDLALAHKLAFIDAFSAKVNIKALKKLANSPKVKYISLDEELSLFLGESIPLIGADQANAKQINNYNLTGHGVSVCVIDTGVYADHPNLVGAVVNESCFCSRGGACCPNGASTDSNASDDFGHGTQVSGVIAGRGSWKGVAPEASIVMVKAFDEEGYSQETDILAGLQYCLEVSQEYNISVVSLSLGFNTFYSSQTACDAGELTRTSHIYDAIVNLSTANITVVAAAGNQGDPDSDSYNEISSPACLSSVISVGSSTDGSSGVSADQQSVFSNSANFLDLFAPGENITTTTAPVADCSVSNYCSDTGYISVNGTSFAAPHVAGVAALVHGYYHNLSIKVPPTLVRSYLSVSDTQILKRKKTASGELDVYIPRVDAATVAERLIEVNVSQNSVATPFGMVAFPNAVDYTKLLAAVRFENNKITINTSLFAELDVPARLTLLNLTYEEFPIILRDGVVCLPPSCNISVYDGNLTFNVSGFSSYSSRANSKLVVWDDNDLEGGYLNRSTADNVTFYANFTNTTSGDSISDANCTAVFSDAEEYNFSYNVSNSLYNLTRQFNPADNYDYNVTCDHTTYENLTISDDITVTAGCGLPPPGVDWVLSGNDSVVCDGERLFFQNQSLLLKDNADLTIIDGEFTLSYDDLDAGELLNISTNASISIMDSNITNNISASIDDFMLNIYGYCNLTRVVFNNSNFNVDGDKTCNINSIDVNSLIDLSVGGSAFVSFTGLNLVDSVISTLTISENAFVVLESSHIENNVVVRNSANLNMTDVSIGNILDIGDNGVVFAKNITAFSLQLYDYADINFTTVQSNITNAVRISPTGPAGQVVISGYVDMPPDNGLSFIAGPPSFSLNRFYPTFVNYVGGARVADRNVSVSNSSFTFWNGSTNSVGVVNPNLTLYPQGLSLYPNGSTPNINVSTNESKQMSFLTDTPITLHVTPPTTPSNPPTGGGGGGCTPKWACEWSECIDGVKTYHCEYTKYCAGKDWKPEDKTEDCSPPRPPVFDDPVVTKQSEPELPPVEQAPSQPGGYCGDGVCLPNELCTCWQDCKSQENWLVLFILGLTISILTLIYFIKYLKNYKERDGIVAKITYRKA